MSASDPYARRAAIVLAGVFLLQWLLLFSRNGPTWDAVSYYAQARSPLFDGDLWLANDITLSFDTATADFAAKRTDLVRTVTGRVDTPFALGSALLWLPWLALWRGVVTLWPGVPGGAIPLTGYEWVFTLNVAALSAVFGLLAFWVAYRLAAALTAPGPALLATVTLMWTTPLVYYQFREPLYAHVASALTATLYLAYWWRRREAPGSLWHGLALGALLGLTSLARWQNVIYLLLPLATVLTSGLDRPAGSRRPRLRRSLPYLAGVCAGFLALFSLQMAVWRLFYGSWLTVPQGGSFMDWRAGNLGPLLLSTFRGLLAWMPVFLPSALGLGRLAIRQPRLGIPLAAVLVLSLYVNSSARDWFAGGGYGPRRFSGMLPILLLGYAACLQGLPRRWRPGAGVLLGLALGWQQFILLRYGLLERLGGRVVSMAPGFAWAEDGWGPFLRAVAGHWPDALRQPAAFWILPASPLDLWLNHQVWPVQQLAALALSALFVVAAIAGVRAVGPRLARSGSLRAALAGGGALLILLINQWIMNRA